jgi:hypothetical protein
MNYTALIIASTRARPIRMTSPSSTPPPDLELILAAIREEAGRRGAARVPAFDLRAGAGTGAGFARRPALPGPTRHVRDYLSLGSEGFLEAAYRNLLNRPPDAKGAAGYRRALRTGQRTKIEVLARIRYSSEGRRHGVAVSGLLPALGFALAYRVPIAGALLAGVAIVLRLPMHWRDRTGLERLTQETASELEG